MDHNLDDHIHSLEQKAENLQNSVKSNIFLQRKFMHFFLKGEIYRMCKNNGGNFEPKKNFIRRK